MKILTVWYPIRKVRYNHKHVRKQWDTQLLLFQKRFPTFQKKQKTKRTPTTLIKLQSKKRLSGTSTSPHINDSLTCTKKSISRTHPINHSVRARNLNSIGFQDGSPDPIHTLLNVHTSKTALQHISLQFVFCNCKAKEANPQSLKAEMKGRIYIALGENGHQKEEKKMHLSKSIPRKKWA